jgi:penicillin-binding protein 1A
MTHSQRTRRRRRSASGGPRSKALLAVLVVGIVVALAGLGAIGYVVSIAASAPPLTTIKARDPGQTSSVYARDGTRLGFIQANDLRVEVAGDKLPKSLKDATVAIEDERFYHHKGVDYEGVVRAAVENLTSGETVQGGSTLTMQLVRNLYITDERTYERKIREAKLAEELENEQSKSWILATYLNSVPYGTVGGQSALGAGAAARIYFSKRVEDLKLHESALLAGLPQAPSQYSPLRSEDNARDRRDQVLAKMAELGMIQPRTAQRAMRRGLGLKPSSYFTARREKFFFDYVKDELIKEYGAARVRRGGMKVYTTIDLRKQRAAREAIAGRLGSIGPSGAVVTINPRNGEIEAMASSASYSDSKFNLAAQGRRQPGSTFKIMALMAALRQGVDPDSTSYVSRSPTKLNEPVCGPRFEIKTFDGSSRGNISLTRATLASDNSVFIQLALDVGPDQVKKTAWDMGIRSKLDGYCAETLGGLTRGVSPLEMANAYATIASGGYRHRPTAIRRIVFPGGKRERPERFRPKRFKVFSDGVTAKATEILIKNIEGGTGTAADIGCPAGGKTGTTDKNTDAWFVGFTPRLATAVWVGYPSENRQMAYEYGGGSVEGGEFPAEIWGDYMGKVKRGCGDFRDPTEPFQSAPFDGKYARSGGELLGEGELDSLDGTGVPGPGELSPGPSDEAPAPDRGQRDREGGEELDPRAYESPPMATGEEAGADGGTAAPDGA